MLNSPAAFFADNRLCYKDGPLHAIFRLQARLKPAVIDVFQARSDRDCVAIPDSCFHFTRILFTLRFRPTDNGCRFSARLSFASGCKQWMADNNVPAVAARKEVPLEDFLLHFPDWNSG